MRCSTPCGSVRRKYESTIVFESSACAGLINTTRRAPSCPASQAAMVSLVTSQECGSGSRARSEEHTSELQSPCNLVCRLLLEKKKKKEDTYQPQILINTVASL